VRHTRIAPPLEKVREFWERNPLSAAAVGAEPGSPEFFEIYDRLRERNEPVEFASRLHEYDRFSGQKVLEVGCGNAYTLLRYAEHGALVYGIDVTQAAIDICRQRFAQKGRSGDFRVGDAEALPYGSDSFDCICSMGVLHHVPHTDRAVSEIHRCLKPGGRVIVMVYHRRSFHYQVTLRLLARLAGKSMQQVLNEVDGAGNPKGDVYSKREIEELLKDFRDLEVFAGLLWLPRLGVLLPSSMGNPIGRSLGWFLYAKGRK
jgi:ubiquinone/menaquinone biosynthesis C-methylase UbiE